MHLPEGVPSGMMAKAGIRFAHPLISAVGILQGPESTAVFLLRAPLYHDFVVAS
jgi:hypothetical protein